MNLSPSKSVTFLILGYIRLTYWLKLIFLKPKVHWPCIPDLFSKQLSLSMSMVCVSLMWLQWASGQDRRSQPNILHSMQLFLSAGEHFVNSTINSSQQSVGISWLRPCSFREILTQVSMGGLLILFSSRRLTD